LNRGIEDDFCRVHAASRRDHSALAQSLLNYGPNAPANGDSFGKPYSGAQPPKSKDARHTCGHRSSHRTARSSSHGQTEGSAPSK